jgi:hypothetical protein
MLTDDTVTAIMAHKAKELIESSLSTKTTKNTGPRVSDLLTSIDKVSNADLEAIGFTRQASPAALRRLTDMYREKTTKGETGYYNRIAYKLATTYGDSRFGRHARSILTGLLRGNMTNAERMMMCHDAFDLYGPTDPTLKGVLDSLEGPINATRTKTMEVFHAPIQQCIMSSDAIPLASAVITACMFGHMMLATYGYAANARNNGEEFITDPTVAPFRADLNLLPYSEALLAVTTIRLEHSTKQCCLIDGSPIAPITDDGYEPRLIGLHDCFRNAAINCPVCEWVTGERGCCCPPQLINWPIKDQDEPLTGKRGALYGLTINLVQETKLESPGANTAITSARFSMPDTGAAGAPAMMASYIKQRISAHTQAYLGALRGADEGAKKACP